MQTIAASRNGVVRVLLPSAKGTLYWEYRALKRDVYQ